MTLSISLAWLRKGYPLLCQFKSNLLGKFAATIIPLLGYIVRKKPWNTTLSMMRKMPETSLGFGMAKLLDREGHQLIPKFENHDAHHLLLGYKMTGLGKARLQFFLVGNGHKTLISMGTCLFSLAVFPELYALFYKDYLRGKTYCNISAIDFQNLLTNDLETLKLSLVTSASAD